MRILTRIMRISIYISEDLKARMDAIGDSVSWSKIATQAFEDALRDSKEIRQRRVKTTMAIELPFPTSGDYKIFEAHVGGLPYQVKVSGSARAQQYRSPLGRIVARFAEQVLQRHPKAKSNEPLPETLFSDVADRIDKDLAR